MTLLKGKVAIITGGSSGIGKATSELFCNQGAKVIILDTDSEKGYRVQRKLKSEGGDVSFEKVDVSDSTEVHEVFEKIKQKNYKIDILCNVAGIGLKKKMHTISEEEWDKVCDVNLKGVFLMSKYAVKSMLDGGGSIINVSSVHSQAAEETFSVYAMTKGGVNAFTRGIAIDYASYGIRANSVLPSTIMTEQVEKRINNHDNPKELRYRLENKQPLRRAGDPMEVSKLILFLASDLSSFITGGSYTVDGGLLARLPTNI